MGREFTCGCIERSGTVDSLPVVEAITAGGFLGHVEKHRGAMVRPVLHTTDGSVTRVIKDVSVRLFRLFRLSTMCRFDYIVDPLGHIYYLEANSMPGLSDGSAFPRMLEAVGLNRADLLELAIESWARTYRRRKHLPYVIDHTHANDVPASFKT